MRTTETVDEPRSGWFKSSRSNDGPNCVEVKFEGDSVLIRDSKYLRDPANEPSAQPVITVPVRAWDRFLGIATGLAVVSDEVPTIDRHESGQVSIVANGGLSHPGESGDFISWEGWSRVEEEVPGRAA
ncbi:DUF397 domain-containing protein [Nocardia arthritidis]|uniref:DUF397 domain-containing protein n=1 Tax=Nocardia arthritidis TaxID=228602 RepID=A0A6G9Y6J3_9NOCA|nr:DUF397 domain-containing protein [Nocardia arthritidis]QIS08822.1 DUF397 domain-containing protein [Nocardia arthritidis]